MVPYPSLKIGDKYAVQPTALLSPDVGEPLISVAYEDFDYDGLAEFNQKITDWLEKNNATFCAKLGVGDFVLADDEDKLKYRAEITEIEGNMAEY